MDYVLAIQGRHDRQYGRLVGVSARESRRSLGLLDLAKSCPDREQGWVVAPEASMLAWLGRGLRNPCGALAAKEGRDDDVWIP